MTFSAFLAKDLRLEWRSRDVLAAAATVALLIALVGNVAFADRVDSTRALPGVLWMAIVFAAQVGLARSFVVEKERGTLDAALASPAGSFGLFVSKLVVHSLALLVVGAVAAWVLVGFFRLGAVERLGWHLLVFLLGVVGVAVVTTMTASIAMHGTHWVLLVPLLSLPLLFPVAVSAVSATDLLLQTQAPIDAVLPHLRILAAYDVIALTAAWLLVPYVLEP